MQLLQLSDLADSALTTFAAVVPADKTIPAQQILKLQVLFQHIIPLNFITHLYHHSSAGLCFDGTLTDRSSSIFQLIHTKPNWSRSFSRRGSIGSENLLESCTETARFLCRSELKSM